MIFRNIKKIDINLYNLIKNNDLLNNNIIILQKNKKKQILITTEEKLFKAIKFLNNNINISNKYKNIIYTVKQDIYKKYEKKYLSNKYTNNIEQKENEDISNIENLLKTNFELLTNETEESEIIKLLNSIIYNAIEKNSSDIHLEVYENIGKIRFRIDGILEDFLEINKKIIKNLSNRIKYMSLLNISENKKAQDGNITVSILNTKIDIRISIIPTYYGERIVLRLLMNSKNIPKIEELGYDKETLEKLKKINNKSYGIFLIAGPTGSGKTTTLHSFLKEKNSKDINIITVEDPIEYKTDYANQIQINNENEFGFKEALKSVLRQDPDVLMIGEIRDKETADIAIKASLTGHYVLSSIHANDSITCISRLLDMGIDKFLLKDSILGIMSQRLIRKKCDCNNGCKKCNYTKYNGRKIIYELLIFDENIKKQIDDFSYNKILNLAKEKQNFKPMKDLLLNELKKGFIDKKEYERIGI